MEKIISKKKVNIYNIIDKHFENVENFIIIDCRGMSVFQMTELRKNLREKGSELRILKNKIAKLVLASKDIKNDSLNTILKGPTAGVLINKNNNDDSNAIAKILIEKQNLKDYPLTIKGALIENEFFDFNKLNEYSNLPSRPELIARLMGTINAPAQNFVCVLNEVISKFVRTLQAVADNKNN